MKTDFVWATLVVICGLLGCKDKGKSDTSPPDGGRDSSPGDSETDTGAGETDPGIPCTPEVRFDAEGGETAFKEVLLGIEAKGCTETDVYIRRESELYEPATPLGGGRYRRWMALEPGRNRLTAVVFTNGGVETEAGSVTYEYTPTAPVEGKRSGFIAGEVRQQGSGEPVAGALVYLREVAGEMTTDDDGVFRFPTPDAGQFLLTVETEGYTLAQRRVDVFSGHDAGAKIRLVKRDTRTTRITPDEGGSLTNSAGDVALEVPPGAVRAPFDISAVSFPVAEALPDALPASSRWTQAFDLSPDGVRFDKDAVLKLKNELGFPPGTSAPLGYYNRDLGAWQPAGMGKVSDDGEWVELSIEHFSPYDCNYPAGQNRNPGAEGGMTREDCFKAVAGASLIDEIAGQLTLFVPATWRLARNEREVLRLVYRSDAASGTAYTVLPYLAGGKISAERIEAVLSMEGVESALSLDVDEPAATYMMGVRHDPENLLGEPLETGVYPATLTLRTLARSTYQTADEFGAPGTGETGVETREAIPYETSRTLPVPLDDDREAPFGAGWRLEAVERIIPSPELDLALWEHDGARAIIYLGLVEDSYVEVGNTDIQAFHILHDDRVVLVGTSAVRLADDLDSAAEAKEIYTSAAEIRASAVGQDGLVLLDADGTLIWLDPDGTVTRSRDLNGPVASLLMEEGLAGMVFGLSLSSHLAVGSEGVVYIDMPTVGFLAVTPTANDVEVEAIHTLEFPDSGKMTSGVAYDPEENALFFADPVFDVIQKYDLGARNETTFVSTSEVSRLMTLATDRFPVFRGPHGAIYYITQAGDFGRFTPGRLHARMDGAPRSPFLSDGCELLGVGFLSSGTPVIHCAYDYDEQHRFARVDMTGGRERGTGAVLRRDGAEWRIEGQGELRRFDAEGRLLERRTPEGDETFEYEDGRLTRYGRDGFETTFAYTAGRLSGIQDSSGNDLTVEVDDQGDLVRLVDASGVESTFAYDDHHRMTARSVDGYRVDYTWDDGGSVTAAELSTGEQRAYRSVFQAVGAGGIAPIDEATAVFVDGEGRTTTVSYGNDGQRSAIDFDGETWQLASDSGYAAGGDFLERQTVSWETDQIRYEYAESVVSDREVRIEYNTEEALRIRYDAEGRMTDFSADGLSCDFYYYDDRDLLEYADCSPVFYARYEYDADGVITGVFDYDDNAWRVAMDDSGNPVSVTDPLGGVTVLVRDSRGYVTEIADPGGRSQRFESDGFGNLILYEDATGAVSRFTYRRAATCPECGEHGIDVLSSVTDPAGNTWTYGVRADGLYESAVNPLGETRTYTYDAGRRLTGIAGEGSPGISAALSPRGDPLTLTIGDEVTTFTYDEHNRLTEAASPDIRVARRYTGFGDVTTTETVTDLVTGVTFEVSWEKRETRAVIDGFTSSVGHDYSVSGGAEVDSAYPNDDGLPTVDLDRTPVAGGLPDWLGVYDSASGYSVIYESRWLDELGRVDSSDHYAGVDDDVYDSLTYTYEGSRPWIQSISAAYGTLFPVSTTYTHDAAGRLTGMDGPVTEQYTYDAAGRLAGSLFAGAFSYDAAGRLRSTALATYTYEPRGTRLTRTDGATGDRFEYTFDGAERLVRVDKLAGTDTAPYSVVSLAYDPFNRLTRVDVDGEITHLMWLQHTLLAELDGDGNLVRRYLPSDPSDHVAAVFENGEDAYVVADPMGSVHRLVDTRGADLARYVYDGFGRVVEATGAMASQPRRFHGMLYLDALGLYYVRARWYDPEIGQFISEDQRIALTPNPHPYSFADNDPTRFYDETGLSPTGFIKEHVGNGLQDAAANALGPAGSIIQTGLKFKDAVSGYNGDPRHDGVVGRKKIWKTIGLDKSKDFQKIGNLWDDFALGKSLKIPESTRRPLTLRDCYRMRR